MAAITISPEKPAEKGTAVIDLTFTDEDGTAVTPTSLAWQLMRSDGTVINGRTFAASPFSGVTIVLSGDDLAIFGVSDNGYRVLSVQGVYASSAGSDLPINAELKFVIDRLVGQVDSA